MTRFYLLAGCLSLFLLAQKTAAQQTYPVRFASGTAHFPENYTQALQGDAFSPDEIHNGYFVRYLQFRELLSDEARRSMENSGVVFVGYVQFGAYLVAIPQKYPQQQLRRLQVRSVVAVQSAWKIARSLREKPYGK